MKLITIYFTLILLMAPLIAGCDRTEQEQQTVPEISDYTGVWITPETYSEREKARLRFQIDDDKITGSIRYSRPDRQDAENVFFFDGYTSAPVPEIAIRIEAGEHTATARLTLTDDLLYVQLTGRSAHLPEIFVLERGE